MKAVNKDKALMALKIKLREAQEQKNASMAAVTNACITIIGGMPEIDVSEGILCGECYFYNAETHRCVHKNGLMGRLRPGMYCCYGCARPDGEEMEQSEEEDFSEFDEDEQEDTNASDV